MDGNRFDTTIKNLTQRSSRRQVFGGLLGGAAATLTGVSILEAKKSTKVKKAKKEKVSFCHKADDSGYRFIRVSPSASKAHLKHGDVQCAPTECQTLTGTCDQTTGACEFTPAAEGTECGVGQLCDATGNCV